MNIDPDTDDDLDNLDRGDDIVAPSTPPTPAAPAAPDPASVADPVDPAAPAEGEADPAAGDADPAAADPAEAAGNTPGPVSYSRFKEVNEKRKELQARIDALEAAAPVAPAVQPAAKPDKVAELIAARLPLYTQVEEARLDGETELAATLQQQIDDLNASILLEKSSAVSKQTVAIDRETQQYEALIDTLESTYPQFRADAPEYDRALIVDINETADAFEARGLSPTAAMHRTLKMFSTRLNPPVAAVPAAPATVAPIAPKPDVGKAVAALNQQPADMTKHGHDSGQTVINPMALSDDEFDALPEQTKKKLRGDFG